MNINFMQQLWGKEDSVEASRPRAVNKNEQVGRGVLSLHFFGIPLVFVKIVFKEGTLRNLLMLITKK